MIIVTNRWKTAMGKTEAGLEWAKKVMAYEKKAGLTAPKWWLLRPITGDTHRFTLVGEFASLAEYEEVLAKRSADSGLQAFSKEMRESDWFVGFERQIVNVVEEG